MENVSSRCGKSDNAPRLRFPEFRGEWVEKKLGEIFKKNTEKNTELKITNVICNSAKNGLIPQREYFDKDIANSENINGYYIIQKYDFVYNPRKSTEAPYGPVSVYKYPDKGIVSPLYLCFRATEKINSDFYEFYFKSSSWHRYIYLSGDNGARHDRVSMRDDVFFAMPVNIPSLPEQKKIAAFFTLLDRRIQKQRQLVESLKTYKRGLLCTLLSEISESVPLASISEYHSSNNTMATIEQHNIGKYPVYDAGGIITSIDNYDFAFDYVAIIKDGSGVGRLRLCQAQSSIIGTLGAIKPRGCSVGYLYAVLQGIDFRQFATGMAIPHIYYKDYKNTLVPFPDSVVQNKIKTILSKIDTLITSETRMLELLQTAKTNLLHRMFI